jgi:hypothetical protein
MRHSHRSATALKGLNGSMTADSQRNLNDLFQHIQDKQEVTLNDRFGVHIGPSGDVSDIQAGMSGMRSKPAVPWHPAYVSVAA